MSCQSPYFATGRKAVGGYAILKLEYIQSGHRVYVIIIPVHSIEVITMPDL